MPELPEAETIARGLRKGVVGRVIRHARVDRADVVEGRPRHMQARVKGRVIADVGRRGKKVLIWLDEGHTLVVSLGMTGRLLHVPAGRRKPSDARHQAVRFQLEGGGSILFDDTRRFGSVALLNDDEWDRRSAAMGPEPLDPALSADTLFEALHGSRSPARSWLLDQRRIAGVGNIYALEALYRAGVHPARPACSITHGEAEALLGALRDVLQSAIQARGTTLRDYRTATGAPGTYVTALSVYGREGQPCPRCSTPVERVVFGNRSAFLCPECQPDTGVDGGIVQNPRGSGENE